MKAVLSLATLLLVACGSPPAPVAHAPAAPAADAPITMPADGDRYEVRIERDHVTVVSGGDVRDVPDVHLAVDSPAVLAAMDDLGLAAPYLLVLADDAAFGRAVAVMDELGTRTPDFSLVPPPRADDPAGAGEVREGSMDINDMPIVVVKGGTLELRDRRSPRPVTLEQLAAALAAADPFPGAVVLQANTNTPGQVVNDILRVVRRQGISSVLFAVKNTNTP
jgi:biopolymer transport protein ExbD